MPIAYTAIIFLSKYFSFDPLNDIVFWNSWPVLLCRIFKNYLVQTEGFLGGEKKVCDMNCTFSVQLLSATLLLPVQRDVQ